MILDIMNQPVVELYFFFLEWALKKIVKLNKLFQSEKSMVAYAFSKMSETFRELLQCFMNRDYLNKNDLNLVQPADESRHIRLQNIYLGVKVIGRLQENVLSVQDEELFRERCKTFLVVVC